MWCRRFACSAFLALLFSAPALAQDADADGVLDAADAFPCDARYAAVAFAPAEGSLGLLMFEDQWPRSGDLDFNDTVVSYGYEYLLDGNGDLVRLNLDLNVHALGGDFDNGLALSLPVPQTQVASVTRLGGGLPNTTLSPSPSDANLVVTIIDDIRALLNGGAGPVFSLVGVPLRITIDMVSPAQLPVGESPHDLHIFRVGQPGLQVHRSAYGGTANVDQTLFGTHSDVSSPGRWYVEGSGLPFVFDLPFSAYFPHEAVAISTLFPDVLTYAATGGAQAADFYATTINTAVGHRAIVAAPLIPTPAQTSCVAQPGQNATAAGSSCSALLAAGQSSSGVYWIDPDGTGGLAPYEAYCEQTIQGGGWILAIANRRQTASTAAIDGVVTPSLTQSALNDARWQFLRGSATQAMATFGGTQIVADMASLRNSNCKPLATSLTAPMLAHHENSGCSGTGTDYSLWFGYRNSWSRANAIYDYSGADYYPGRQANNPGTASMWVR